jgi:hypothetical protein
VVGEVVRVALEGPVGEAPHLAGRGLIACDGSYSGARAAGARRVEAGGIRGELAATMTAAAVSRQMVRPSASPAGWCKVHCGILRWGTTTAPTKAPSRPKYEPVMKLRCVRMRWVRLAHRPMDRVTKVKTDRPWIQLKWPGRSCWMANELRMVQYIAPTQTQPTQRCGRSPLARRARLYAPSAIEIVAAPACSAITTLSAITLL